MLDSNIIIYASKPGYEFLQAHLAATDLCVSVVSFVEVLGFHGLTPPETEYLEDFFANIPMLPLAPSVLDQAVNLRRQRKMTVGDAIVAGTALAYGCTLVTRNTGDFDRVPSLALFNPFVAASAT